ncbi:MAG TPA: DUF72 domain-containing protein [Pyrinomonadaceae bacterium]|nr:DUF72 domain-containing protein [Pyrinomonadaceae bacterium]
MKVFIGTSGWHYKHWLDDVFYPTGTKPSQMFEFYAQHFDTVEINNSFYHLPSATTFDNWRDASPPKFLFAVKASRFITHMKKLKDPAPSSEKFFDVADRLGQKLGPVLFQLPPRWKVNVERFAEFLESLPRGHKYVFEFRDETWFVPEVYALMSRHKAAFCIHDFADMKVPQEITAPFSYIRFHGPTTAKYFGSYSTQQLRAWAERIADWRHDLSAIYIYFNNDPGGEAVKNALELKRLVRGLL